MQFISCLTFHHFCITKSSVKSTFRTHWNKAGLWLSAFGFVCLFVFCDYVEDRRYAKPIMDEVFPICQENKNLLLKLSKKKIQQRVCMMWYALMHAQFFKIPWFPFAQRGIEKNSKKRYNFRFTSWKDLKFHLSVCADILVTPL